MKLNLLLLTLPFAAFAQNSSPVTKPSPYSSGSENIQKFNNKARFFRDWSVSVGGGTALMSQADLTSFYDGKINWGWNGYVYLDKQISHTFGVSLGYQMGQTHQKAYLNSKSGVGTAYTKYKQVLVLGDINFSNLLRRVDNHSPYRWALHGYAGIGVEGYNSELLDNDENRWSTSPRRAPLYIEQKLDFASFFFQYGVGLQYCLSKTIDLETRIMYVATGDDSFDGGGWDSYTPYNKLYDWRSDNYFTVNLGLSVKLGKQQTHLRWYDPLQDINYRESALATAVNDVLICKRGDGDNDGVCDDWDRQLDTPAGARVDGAGVALDVDLDGTIDLNDKCVTVPGPIENNGCPVEAPAPVVGPSSIEMINKDFEGIEFALGKDIIRPTSYAKLDHAAEMIKGLDSNTKFAVIGCTDTRGNAANNKVLSQKRADAVVKYLTNQGVNPAMLVAEGHGQTDLKYPECNPATKCPEWKNEANRRVYFEAK